MAPPKKQAKRAETDDVASERGSVQSEKSHMTRRSHNSSAPLLPTMDDPEALTDRRKWLDGASERKERAAKAIATRRQNMFMRANTANDSESVQELTSATIPGGYPPDETVDTMPQLIPTLSNPTLPPFHFDPVHPVIPYDPMIAP